MLYLGSQISTLASGNARGFFIGFRWKKQRCDRLGKTEFSPECTALLLLRLTFFTRLGKRGTATNEFAPMNPKQSIIDRLDLLRDGQSHDRNVLDEIRDDVKLILEALELSVPESVERARASLEHAEQEGDALAPLVLTLPPQARSEDRLG